MPNEVHTTSKMQRHPASVVHLSWFLEGNIKQLQLGWGRWTYPRLLDHRHFTTATGPLSFVDFISFPLMNKCHTKLSV